MPPIRHSPRSHDRINPITGISRSVVEELPITPVPTAASDTPPSESPTEPDDAPDDAPQERGCPVEWCLVTIEHHDPAVRHMMLQHHMEMHAGDNSDLSLSIKHRLHVTDWRPDRNIFYILEEHCGLPLGRDCARMLVIKPEPVSRMGRSPHSW